MNSNTINSNENELKHRIHLCHLELHEFKEAKAVLERIPSIERNIKILSSLADLYYQEKNCDKARDLYLEILKQDPLRLDLVVKICKLGGCDPNAILDLIPDDVRKTCPWYPTWIQAQCNLHSPNSTMAIDQFNDLTKKYEKRAALLTSLAQAYYHDGNFIEAIRTFKAAYKSDEDTLTGIGSYAACLHKESHKQSLEDLAVLMSSKCNIEGEYFHEPWLALAHYYASHDKKEPKALLFVQKAYKLNRYSIEALILLACLCLEKKDSSKAIPYIVTAQIQAPYRYEVQRILCDAFLANNKKAAALSYAKAATKSLGESARSWYLWADIMLKSQDQRRKNSARNCLEKAVHKNNKYLPAVIAFVELLMEEKKYKEAIGYLEEAKGSHATKELDTYLSRCYSEINDHDNALIHMNNAASSEDATNQKNRHESLHRGAQENAVTQEDVDTLLGLEADELVDHGDSEMDDANLDA